MISCDFSIFFFQMPFFYRPPLATTFVIMDNLRLDTHIQLPVIKKYLSVHLIIFLPRNFSKKKLTLMLLQITTLKAYVHYFVSIFIFFHQMIPLQKRRNIDFVSSKKLFLFSRYSNFCNFSLPLHTFQILRTSGSGIIYDVTNWLA